MDEQIHRLKLDLNRSSEPVVRWMSSCADGTMNVTREVSRFASDRMQQNVETLLAISSQATTPAKVLETQERWFWKTMQDYTDESQRLLSISGDVLHSLMGQYPTATAMVMQATQKK